MQLQRYIDIPMLRYYFDVSNSYVASKLRTILFPFIKKDWDRQGANQGFLTPREDVNAPDLYIPSMAFTTWVLLIGIQAGRQQQYAFSLFTPHLVFP